MYKRRSVTLSESRLRRLISEAVRKALTESNEDTRWYNNQESDPGVGSELDFSPQLWTEIRFVQGGDDDYEEIDRMFCGDDDVYCEGNSQPVIEYLAQWDDGEGNVVEDEPRIARNDTVYDDENGEYILRYNSSVGGCYLLYRKASPQEVDWYQNNR